MGRWSARLASLFLDFAGVDGSGRSLDVGCGTGVLSAAIRARAADAEIAGVDPVADFVADAGRKMPDPKARFQVGSADALPYEDGAFDATLSLLIFQELPDQARAVREMRRVTRPGGRVATSQWDFARGFPMTSRYWEAVYAVLPEAEAERQSGKRMPGGCASEAQFGDLWRGAGLEEVETATLEVTQDFASFEDYWAPFLGGATSTSSYAETLAPEVRAAVKRELKRLVLGEAAGNTMGPVTMTARAFAVRGRVPRG